MTIEQIQVIQEAKLTTFFFLAGWAVIASIETSAIWWFFLKRSQEKNCRTGYVILLMSSAGMVISWLTIIFNMYDSFVYYLFRIWMLGFWFCIFPITMLRSWFAPFLEKFGIREYKKIIRIGTLEINITGIFFLLVNIFLLYAIIMWV